MTTYTLQFHPTPPTIGPYNAIFSSFEEFEAYKQFERRRTGKEIAAYWADVSPGRASTAALLAAKREQTYNRWKALIDAYKINK